MAAVLPELTLQSMFRRVHRTKKSVQLSVADPVGKMPEETMRNIVERIKSRRLELNFSFQDLADLTGMSKSTLQRYETGGIKNIPLDKLKTLAKALEVSPEWIMGWNLPTGSKFDQSINSSHPIMMYPPKSG